MEGTKPINKYYLYGTLFFVFVVFASYIVNINSLVLFAVLAVSAMMFFADLKTATCMLFLFSAFSYIIVYNAISLIVIVAVAYLLKVMLQCHVNINIIATTIVVFGYCMLFNDMKVPFKLGSIISIVFFVLMGVVCAVIKTEDFYDVFKWYLLGVVISAVMGMFTSKIPALAAICNIDYLIIDKYTTQANMYDTIRYAGLSYDPNFFSMSVCVIVSVILFGTEKKLNFKIFSVIIFLTIAGFFTYSKSYLIMVVLIYGIYFLKKDRNLFKKFLLGIVMIVLLIIIDNYLSFGVVQNIVRRFEADSAASNITTGRTVLWKEYFDYITNDVRIMLFGKGYDAHSLRKAVHNTYIEYWYHFGVIGCILWLTYFYVCFSVIKSKMNNTITKKNRIPFITFVVAIFFLNTLKFEHTWMLLCISFYSLKLSIEKSEVLFEDANIKYNSSGV